MTAVSARSYLAAGLAAAVVGTVAVAPIPDAAHTPMASPAVALSAALSDLVQTGPSVNAQAVVATASNPITNAYNRLEPWAAYGADLAQWALSYVPGLWWVAPGIDFAYYSIEPLVQATVFSVSYLLFLQVDQIPQAISNGVQESVDNFLTYGYQWIASLVPLPPLPPFPPRPPFAASAVKTPAGRSAAATRQGVATAELAPAAEIAADDAVAPEAPALAAVAAAEVKPAAARTGVRETRGDSSAPTPAAAGTPAQTDNTPVADVAPEADAKAPARKAHRAARSAS